MAAEVASEVIRQATDALGASKIRIGAPPIGVRILARGTGVMR